MSATGPDAATVVTIEPLQLGLPDLASYGWRKRGGNAYSRPAIHGRPARPHRVPIAPIASPA